MPVEIAHIEPWANVQTHEFDNLIALCPTCHARYDRGEIDRLSMRQYKANLAILTSRYSEFERRVLSLAAEAAGTPVFRLPGGMEILIMYLLRDGLIAPTGQTSGVIIAGVPSWVVYTFTDTGQAFVEAWQGAKPLE